MNAVTIRKLLTVAGLVGFTKWRHENDFRPLYTSMAPEDAAGVRRSFVLLLHDLLQQVHAYNQHRPEWKDQISLQAYAYSDEERGLLLCAL